MPKKIKVTKVDTEPEPKPLKKSSLISELKKARVSNTQEMIKKTHYESIINNIKEANARYSKTDIVYTIPIFLPGYPLYNLEEIISYISNKLKREGFEVRRLDTYNLYISWT